MPMFLKLHGPITILQTLSHELLNSYVQGVMSFALPILSADSIIRIGYNLNVMRQSACLVIYPITVDGYAELFNCTPVDRASDSLMARPKSIHFSWLRPELSFVVWSTEAQLIIFYCFRFLVVLYDRPGISIRHAAHCICRVLVFASS